MPDVDDRVLLRDYVENNSQAAFAALVTRHFNKVYSVAWRHTENVAQAEEIAQAVFIILAKKAGGLSKKVPIEGWLYQTARLTALTAVRGEIRRARREKEAQLQSDLNKDESSVWSQIAPLLDAALSKLNETDRHAVVLRFFYGKSMKEIASALDGSEGAARLRIHRALDKLRQYFFKHGITSTTETITGALSAHSVQVAPEASLKLVLGIVAGKGAAAGSTTANLVGQGLKVMAWHKAKSALTMGAIGLITAGIGLSIFHGFEWYKWAHGPDIQGAWEGRVLLEFPGVESPDTAASCRVVLKLVKMSDGYKAAADWIEMGRNDVPMGRVTYHYPSLRIEAAPHDTWNLRVNDDATQMVWNHYRHFIQAVPVLLLRTSKPDIVPPRLEETEFTPRPGSDLQGYWKGKLSGNQGAPVDLKIAALPDGTFRAEGDSPMDGVIGLPVVLRYERPLIKFTDAIGTGLFQGALKDGGAKIVGSWTQSGKTEPASFERADYPAEHAGDDDKDYSFHSANDLQGHWRGSWNVTIVKTKATIRLALDIARCPDGSYAATLSKIDEFGNDGPMPPSEFQYDPPKLRMRWRWAGDVAFEGELKDGKLAGKWLQGGGGFPLVFERMAK